MVSPAGIPPGRRSGLSPSTFAEPIRAPARERAPVARARPLKLRRVLHAALLATAVAVFLWTISLPIGVVGGAAGAVAGAFLAERMLAERYRLLAVLAAALGVVLVGRLMMYVFIEATWMAEVVSPVGALQAAELLRWGSVGLGAVLTLRALAIRYRVALVVEGGAVVIAVATTVAAHRNGMIARPLEVSDWFWTQGIDPVVAFLAIGLGGALLLAGVLAQGRSTYRTIAQVAFVLFLGVILALRIHGADVDDQDKRALAGSEKDDKDENRDGQRGGGKGGQSRPSDGNPSSGFKQDDMPNPGGGQQKNRPAAIVVFHKDLQPAAGVFYFRHASFSQFNGSRLIEATRGDVDTDVVRAFPTRREEVNGPKREVEGRELVATDVALLTEHRRLFALTDAVEVAPMPNPEPARFRRAYSVVSSVVTAPFDELLGYHAGDPSWSDETWEHYTALPKDPRYRELAGTLKKGLRKEYANDPIAEALSVKRYLEENATYSFKRDYEGEDDPTAAFLFSEDKRGYCVHLAHAAAYLLRAMGVPTRVSAGYGVPAQNLGNGSSLLIKSGDAHAWAEVYLEEVGWVPVEVTPEKSDVEAQAFNERDLQQLLGEMARKEGRDTPLPYQGPRLMDMLRAVLAWAPRVLLGLLALAYLMKLGRLAAPYFAGARRQPIVAYRAALDRLSAAGILREHGEPRERFAKRVEGLAPSFRSLTHKHVGVAFGSRDALRSIGSVEGVSLARLSSRVGSEVRKNVPAWRWVLGVVNPLSWLWSR